MREQSKLSNRVTRRRTRTALALAFLLVTSACGGGKQQKPAAARGNLKGLFRIAAGECGGAGMTGGSYFRMVNVGGKPETGPFVSNSDSPCGDQTFTPMKPGSDGGLTTGSYQPNPDPAFGPEGSGAAARITEPAKWFGVSYSLATNKTDPQTGKPASAPALSANAGKLSGDLRAFAAAWNRQHFNQGSPKPDGAKPGNTSGPTGTYDPATKTFTLDWTSQIVGGPFNNFTGKWHLEGTFEPR